jgi:hypothetical protein
VLRGDFAVMVEVCGSSILRVWLSSGTGRFFIRLPDEGTTFEYPALLVHGASDGTVKSFSRHFAVEVVAFLTAEAR